MKTRMSVLFGLLAVTLPAIAGLTGCRSWDCGRGGGCGSGCCLGTSPEMAAGTTKKPGPVTGKELGSMGVPVAVTIKGRTVLVCCQGCVEKLKSDPERYLAGVTKAPPRPEEGSTSQAGLPP